MKIGLVCPYYMHRPGGVQTDMLAMRELLIKKGHDVWIIAPKPRSDEFVQKTPEGVLLLGLSAEVKFRAPFHTTHPVAAVFDQKKIDEFLAKHNFDILNVHEPWMPLLPYQIVARATCPVVGTLHARWPRSIINRTIEKARGPYVRATMRRLDSITAVSTVAAENAHEVDPEAQVTLIPNAIDVSAFQQLMQESVDPDSSRYILYLNRLEKRKGPMLLLKAYKKLVESYPVNAPKLIIAGGGPQEDKLKEYVEKNELDGVEFEGFVTERRKAELFANAQLYVSPAPYGESFGIVLVEAMAARVPAVAGNNEGYKTVLHGAGAISLVDPRDPEALCERIKVMYDNQELRGAWQTWAASELPKYDFKTVVDQYEAEYMKVLNI